MPPVYGTEKIISPLQKSHLNKKGLCDYVVNVASGCLHGCTFCYVPSTPSIRTRQKYLKQKGIDDPQMDWGQYLLVRENLPDRLEQQLTKKRKWHETASGKGVVLLCSGTDPYQNPRVSEVTHQALVSLLRFNKRIRVLTRSPLFIRDIDLLIDPMVTVGMSLPHLDDQLSRLIEPNAPLPTDRLKALRRAKKAGCRIYVAIAPTPPNMSQVDFLKHLETLLTLEPEVIFWEPINARGSNGKRMLSAGLEFVNSVMSYESWAENFLRQWEFIEKAANALNCLDILHIWPDPGLKKILQHEKIDYWLFRPTVETWE
jgi:DNA repair photolyase